jgi:tetratricopeptide (TPR) repeat protein
MYWTLLRVNFLIPSTILMRRAEIIQAGLFDPAFRRLQDWELWLRLLRDGHVFAGLPECLVHYRLHGNALSDDPAGGEKAALALVNKHFGPDDGQWLTWQEDKRRGYAGVYRYHALMSLQRQGNWELCADYLRKAFQIDPTLAEDQDLFYELALGNQPAGYRGLFGEVNLEANARNVSRLLQMVFQSKDVNFPVRAVRPKVYGNAYLALGLVAYGGRRMTRSRQYLFKAIRARPGFLFRRQVILTLIKSCLGSRLVSYVRSWRTRSSHSAAT